MAVFDLSKVYDFFQANKVKGRIHIIGCGSVGSTIAENLVRCGVENITLWDFDTVSSHNVANQMFGHKDVGRLKVEALADILETINPDIRDHLSLKKEGWQGEMLSGYIFLCPDSVDLRRKFIEQHMDNLTVKAVFDVRTLLTGAQHYAADWTDMEMKKNLLNTMQFSDAEADLSAPVSACGVTLGVATTVRIICAYAVNNWMNFVKGEGIKKFIQFDGFKFDLIAF